MMKKILVDKRMKTAYKNEQNKITEYFALKKPEDIQYANVGKEEDIKEETKTAEIAEIKEEEPMTKTLTVEGMMCMHCEARVKKALEAIDGVESAVASHEAGTAVVTLSKDVPDDVLKKAVEDQDYPVKDIA